MSKKVAIVFTGRLIVDPNQYQNFKDYFLTPLTALSYEIDIYVSHSKGYTPEHIQEFINLYHPRKIVESSEDIIDVRSYPTPNGNNKRNVMCMYLSRRNARDLLEGMYDLVISSRSDLWFKAPIPFSQLTKPGIHIPEGFDYTGLNDQCAFGSMAEMRVYLNKFLFIVFLQSMRLGVIASHHTIFDVFAKQNVYHNLVGFV
ncbi:hypothetical protein EBU71_14635 [bacterium]|nr:hypothetical protein [Candidatus Elulimicrobium humile]